MFILLEVTSVPNVRLYPDRNVRTSLFKSFLKTCYLRNTILLGLDYVWHMTNDTQFASFLLSLVVTSDFME